MRIIRVHSDWPAEVTWLVLKRGLRYGSDFNPIPCQSNLFWFDPTHLPLLHLIMFDPTDSPLFNWSARIKNHKHQLSTLILEEPSVTGLLREVPHLLQTINNAILGHQQPLANEARQSLDIGNSNSRKVKDLFVGREEPSLRGILGGPFSLALKSHENINPWWYFFSFCFW